MKKVNFGTFLKKVILFLIPVFILVSCYFICDPFKVLKNYQSYSNNPVVLNQGYICWQNYLNRRDSLKYDSYILGNSCTMAYQSGDWAEFLSDAKPVRLFGSSESLQSILLKLRALDKDEVRINNVLLLLDRGTLQKITSPLSHSRILHPKVCGSGVFEFQKVFFSAFINPQFLIPFLDYRLFGTYRSYMKGIIEVRDEHRNELTNDIINPREEEIALLGDKYWEKHRKEFPERDGIERIYEPSVGKKQEDMLREISMILKQHNTNYRIVINPEYKQYRLNPMDFEKLKQIFGEDSVFDFSGVNDYTDNPKNFYEKSHYRPLLGRMILKEIYN